MQLKLRVVSSIRQVDPNQWDLCAGHHPLTRHAFLLALETSGALGERRGVLPRYVLIQNSDHELVAGASAMLKWGTTREYGPEAVWLSKGLRNGCFSWPKFQLGVPFFPMAGSRLLVRPDMASTGLEAALLQNLLAMSPRIGSADVFNIMHITPSLADRLQKAGATLSCEWQSMWHNKEYKNLETYLAAIPAHKRSRFLKERETAEAHGLAFNVLRGAQIDTTTLADYYEGHRRVCERHGHQPWLPEQTYRSMVTVFGDAIYLFGYFNQDARLEAGVLDVHAHDENILYTLQWSERHKFDSIALDLICTRPIDFAIEHGIGKIDSGLAAPHKQLRGWKTEPVYHAHWFGNPVLKELALLVLGAPS